MKVSVAKPREQASTFRGGGRRSLTEGFFFKKTFMFLFLPKAFFLERMKD
jgi:hypothetical protein